MTPFERSIIRRQMDQITERLKDPNLGDDTIQILNQRMREYQSQLEDDTEERRKAAINNQ